MATHLIDNEELWFLAESTADWVILDSLQQVVSVPLECFLAFGPKISTLVVPTAKAEHTPSKHAGCPCNGWRNLDSPYSTTTPPQLHTDTQSKRLKHTQVLHSQVSAHIATIHGKCKIGMQQLHLKEQSDGQSNC